MERTVAKPYPVRSLPLYPYLFLHLVAQRDTMQQILVAVLAAAEQPNNQHVAVLLDVQYFQRPRRRREVFLLNFRSYPRIKMIVSI